MCCWSIHLLLPNIPLKTLQTGFFGVSNFHSQHFFLNSIRFPKVFSPERIHTFPKNSAFPSPFCVLSCSFMRLAGMDRTPMATNLALTAAQVSVKGSSTVTLGMPSSPSTTETSTLILMGESPRGNGCVLVNVGDDEIRGKHQKSL